MYGTGQLRSCCSIDFRDQLSVPGELVGGMRSLQESIRRLEEGSTRAEDKAATSRAAVHQRMDQLVDRVGHVEASVATISEDVAEMFVAG